MNKKQVRLTESDLKQIVKQSVNKILNEAYGTPSDEDRKAHSDLEWSNAGVPGVRDFTNNDEIAISYNNNKIAIKFAKIYEGLYMVMRETETGSSNPYSEKILDLVIKARKIADLWRKQEIMKLGQQPDYSYEARHEKPDYSYLSDPGYMQQRERAYGA